MSMRSALLCALLLASAPAGAANIDDVPLDTAEADAALSLIDLVAAGQTPSPAAWQRLHDSNGYRLLHARERAMHRDFSDEEFAAFLRAPETIASRGELRRTLETWRARGLDHALALAHAYLPPSTPIHARVLIMVKPRKNSFVFEHDKIFLYLDPSLTSAQFENTAAHELHHIGLSAACPSPDPKTPQDLARAFVGGFGEGFAMLAAAGGPDVHPHAHSKPEDRARWDRDLGRADADLAAVDRFLVDVLDGKYATDADAAFRAAAPFWGDTQGAWYTVGWRLATAIERRFGRARLVADFCAPARLVDDWNHAAPPGAARFSPRLVAGLRAN